MRAPCLAYTPTVVLCRIILGLTLLGAFFGISSSAYAQQGGLLLQIDTEYERATDPSRVQGLRDVQSAGLSIDANGRMGRGHIASSAFLDAHFGAGLQGGFAYRFALLPLGVALYDKEQRVRLSVAGGLMLQGVTDHQPLGFGAPLRASLVVRLGDHLLINVWASQELSLRKVRSGGSEHALFGDEMRAGLVIRVGSSGSKGTGRRSVRYGSGYFVGVLYAERLTTEFWGLTIGHGMNMRGG